MIKRGLNRFVSVSILLISALLVSCVGTDSKKMKESIKKQIVFVRMEEAKTFDKQETNKIDSNNVQGDNKPSDIFKENNPIDEYFDTFNWDNNYSTATMNQFVVYLKEAWKNEMIHAYELLLKKANPKTTSPIEEIIKSRDSFIQYVESDSWIEAYAMASNAFGDTLENGTPTGNYSESISSGTIINQLVLGEQWVHYKTQTLYLFDILNSLNVETNFIFTPSEELKIFFGSDLD